MNLTQELLAWYAENKRDLPWRNTTNPYYIWLSEIILQQTRVVQGWDYYLRFIENFPTVFDLAAADEEKVLKLWQGLGYYSRARNLHFTAQKIAADYNGIFPKTAKELQKLKGIGAYSAAAIASFAFNECVPAVDGNVLRVVSRLFGIFEPIDSLKGKNAILEKLHVLIDKKHSGTFNQAIIEFGALYCKPSSPDCMHCIFAKTCYANKQQCVNQLPIKSQQVKMKERYFYYLVIADNQQILLHKRTQNDIWKGLYDFPLIESPISLDTKKLQQAIKNKLKLWECGNFKIISQKSEIKHQLTHQSIYVNFVILEIQSPLHFIAPPYIWAASKQIHDYPVPRLIELFWEMK